MSQTQLRLQDCAEWSRRVVLALGMARSDWHILVDASRQGFPVWKIVCTHPWYHPKLWPEGTCYHGNPPLPSPSPQMCLHGFLELGQ